MAERDVAVKRKLGRLGGLFAPGKRSLVVGRVDGAVETVGRRVGRVARCGHVELFEQRFVGQLHACACGVEIHIKNL